MSKDNKKSENNRIPIVTILGHVDHGKTSILDQIRGVSTQELELGGITQKTSVFTVDSGDSNSITFVDTPGHESFDFMRTRGGTVADIILLVVAADDGVKPQTKESIDIINNSNANPIVVINKVDLPDVNIEAVKRELATNGLQVEELGGKVPCVEVSAKENKGIQELLEMILLVVDVEGFTDRGGMPEGIKGRSYVVESVKDSSMGNVSTLIVIEGEVNKGDWLIYKDGDDIVTDRVKGVILGNDDRVKSLSTGAGGHILGLSVLLGLGSEIFVSEKVNKKSLKTLFTEEEKAKDVDSEPAGDELQDELQTEDSTDSDDLSQLSAMLGLDANDEDKTLKVLIKASSEGSLEAIINSLKDLTVEDYSVKFVSTEVGDISMKDIETAEVTGAIILGFEVKVSKELESLAQSKGVLTRTYGIIYKLIEEVNDALTVLAIPDETEEELGSAIVKQIFELSDGSKVVGCRVKEGMIKKGEKCYIVRNDEILSEGKIVSMKHQKEEILESKKGDDFGVIIDPTPEVAEGDELHCFKVVKG